MNNDIEISAKFEPLFELLEGLHPEVDTVLMTGGRGSTKSYTVGVFSVLALTEYQYNILYTRFTNTSIVDSIKPEVSDKIDILGKRSLVNDTNTHIECGDNRIAFKGIKTGSKQQTANLKSLSNFNVFVVDEADELPDYETFKKVFYSIRSTTRRNITILILNPTSINHWIFNEFFEKRDIEGGSNCIKDNVMYIHTSYLDAKPQYIAENIRRDYERLKETNPDQYNNVVLGGWLKEIEGLLLPPSCIRYGDLSTLTPDDCDWRIAIGDPADRGGDKYAVPFVWVVVRDKRVTCFVKDVICNTDGIEVNTERIKNKASNLQTEEIYIESNGVGLAAVLLLKKLLPPSVSLRAFPSSEEKEIRILSNYEFIRDNFVFDEKYKSNPEYSQFMSDLTGYIKDGDNKHKKDAIDVLSTAAKIVKVKFGKYLYS